MFEIYKDVHRKSYLVGSPYVGCEELRDMAAVHFHTNRKNITVRIGWIKNNELYWDEVTDAYTTFVAFRKKVNR